MKGGSGWEWTFIDDLLLTSAQKFLFFNSEKESLISNSKKFFFQKNLQIQKIFNQGFGMRMFKNVFIPKFWTNTKKFCYKGFIFLIYANKLSILFHFAIIRNYINTYIYQYCFFHSNPYHYINTCYHRMTY